MIIGAVIAAYIIFHFVAAFFHPLYDKPVIYIHNNRPPQIMESFDVKLTVNADVHKMTLYPIPAVQNNTYEWNVTTYGGTTQITFNGKQYPYLFWEAEGTKQYKIEEGWCVRGEDTVDFLEEKLTLLGLDSTERTDFITYWLPKMQDNAYNIISFVGMDSKDQYNKDFELSCSNNAPIHRILMLCKPSNRYVNVPEQIIIPADFSADDLYLVEWGGTILQK